jgi:hypothetical protein
MEVQWENGSGERQRWSSWDDQIQNGWFEAEKILPSSATDISVEFKVRHLFDGATDVRKVDRRQNCEWVSSTELHSKGAAVPEVIWLRAAQSNHDAPVDVIFQMKGPALGCHVARAWNTARFSAPEYWELWERRWRPSPEPRLATMVAADQAAAPNAGLGQPADYLESRQKRLSAAASKLMEIRRDTIDGLRQLDAHFTAQWVGVNSGNTAAAGLAVGSAIGMFLFPPLGISLGVAAAAAGGATTVADLTVENTHLSEFRRQMSMDMWNAVAVAELENEWLHAREYEGQAFEAAACASRAAVPEDVRAGGTRLIQLGSALVGMADMAGDTLTATGVAAATGATVTRGIDVATSASSSNLAAASSTARLGSVASRAFGVFGAVAATGIAVHGWCTTKISQQVLRAKLAELTSSLLFMQRWLASLDNLECTICLENLSLLDNAARCSSNWHYFHASCLEQWCNGCAGRNVESTCPDCRGEIADESRPLDDFIARDVRSHLEQLPL